MPRAVILTALRVEFRAVIAHLTDLQEDVHPQGTVYRRGVFSANTGSWQVGVAQIGAGNEGAAVEAERAIAHFRPDVIFFVGVAGGVKDVGLFDVIVANKVYGYDFGKVSNEFHPRPDVSESAYPLVQRALAEADKDDWLQRLEPRPRHKPVVHVGPIAAGNKVVASTDSDTFRLIRSRFSDALAVEMEGRGFLKAAWANHDVEALVVRGISDLIDDKNPPTDKPTKDAPGSAAKEQAKAARRDAKRQKTASLHASAFAFEILAKLDPPTGKATGSRDRSAQVESLFRASRARTIEKWQAAGLTEEQVRSFADDPDLQIHAPPEIPDGKLKVAIGEQGIGKSLFAERSYQQAMRNFQRNANASIPVFLAAPDVPGKLQEAVFAAAGELGDPRLQGFFAVIDGADEAGMERAEGLLKEGRILVNSYDNVTVLLTSRPLSVLSNVEEAVVLSPLPLAEAFGLISRIAGYDVDPYLVHYWPQSIQDAIHIPLFALFIGVRLRKDRHSPFGSMAELMDSMVEDSLRAVTSKVREAEAHLKRLARLFLDRGAPVRVSEFDGGANRDILLASRIVIERDRSLLFVLRVHAEWFGTRCLSDGTPSVEDLMDNPQRLKRWRYALAMAVHTLNSEKVGHILAILASRVPLVAAQVMDAAGSRWEVTGASSDSSVIEYGHRLRHAMQTWVTGLGPLAPYVAPLRDDGRLRPLGVRMKEDVLLVSWYCGEAAFPEVLEIPKEIALPTNHYQGWPSVRHLRASDDTLWEWQQTLRKILDELHSLLKKRALLLLSGPIQQESLWKIAIGVAGLGSYNTRPIALASLEATLAHIPEGAGFGTSFSPIFGPEILAELRREVGRLRSAGVAELVFPYPLPDLEAAPGRVSVYHWELYSDDQMLALIQAVYRAAVTGYKQLVETFFPTFAPFLYTYSLFPLRLVGKFRPPARKQPWGIDPGPWFAQFMEPLPKGTETEIEISYGDWPEFKALSDAAYEHHTQERSDALDAFEFYTTTGSPEVFGPDVATKLAYNWLEADLKRAGWSRNLSTL